ISEARIPVREGLRNHGAGVREDRHYPAELPRPASTGFVDTSAMPEGAQFREHIKQNLAAEVLGTTGQVQLAAFGYSMLPSFWPGDLLTIKGRTFGRIRPGDVVLFPRGERWFIHRVVRMEPDRLVTRGDAMPSEDAPIAPEQVMGIVTSVRGIDGRSVAP